MQQIGNDHRQEIRRLDLLIRPDKPVGMNECNNGMDNNCLKIINKYDKGNIRARGMGQFTEYRDDG
jgi:hypothetical protein